MNNFLTVADYLVFISQSVLKKIVSNNDAKQTDAERIAYGYIYEKLSSRFDLDKESAKRGDERNSALVRWMSVLSVYYLYQSIADMDIPERVRMNYEDVIAEIQRVASGKDSCSLSPVTTPEGKPRTKSKFYYSPKKGQRPFGF